LALCAQFIWGAGLSVESAHPVEAEFHFREAQKLLDQQPGYSGLITNGLLQYQLASVVGQQGKSVEAVTLYRSALAFVQEDSASLDLLRQIMLYNNLAYHLSLLGDPSAADYARAGMKLAQERGSLSHMPYLLSTSGEIALRQGDLETAEEYFSQGLRLAEQVQVPERIAGLTANLGLVARQRGQTDQARQYLQQSLTLADQLGVLHLAVRIRIWLAPLLPVEEARQQLLTARRIAEGSGFLELLEQIASLEKHTFPT
jgi:tetratricopeptide (TPR) repeat protein